MPRVSKVRWPRFNLDYGYLFHIITVDELKAYWVEHRGTRIKQGVAEALDSLQGKAHVKSGDGLFAEMAFQQGGAFYVSQKFDEILFLMEKTLLENGCLFVNGLGGYFNLLPDMVVSDTKDVLTWNLPRTKNSKITISKWPGGTHWYVRIDGQDLEFNGSKKWLTKEGAEAAAKAYSDAQTE